MVEDVSAAELHERIEAGDGVQVIDVRSEHAYRRGHIPGAENVPIHQFREAVRTHEWGEEIVIVCPHGKSSLQAARLLEAYEGIDEETRVGNLMDGYDGWTYDLERDTESPDPPF